VEWVGLVTGLSVPYPSSRLATVFAEEVGEFGKAMPYGNYWQNTYKCAV